MIGVGTTVMITADRVYESFPGPVHTPGAVLIEGTRIIGVGPQTGINTLAAPDTKHVALGTGVLMPGFIDSHVHLSFDASDDPVGHLISMDDDALRAVIASNAERLVRAGVTTARDLGARGFLDVRAREQIRSGELVGPDLLLACRPLTTPGGHTWYFGCECADRGALLDAVAAHADAGAEWIKVVLSGGFLTDGTIPAEPQFDLGAMTAVVEAAHAVGLRVATHAHSTRAIEVAACAGVDTIEHATFLAPGGVDFAADVVDRLVRERIPVCPTANSASASYPPASGIEALTRLHELHDRGVPITMGTDAGVRLVPGEHYGYGLLALASAGFGVADVLHAATGGAADALGIADVTGRLRIGLRADLLALAADPLHDLGAVLRPTLVMAAGALIVDERTGQVTR